MRQAELHRMRRIIRELIDMLPKSAGILRLLAGAAQRPCTWLRSMLGQLKCSGPRLLQSSSSNPLAGAVTPTRAAC
jgi:hypothetical protein